MTISNDEISNQDDFSTLLSPVVKSPSVHLYKPRFRGTSGLGSEAPTSSASTSHLPQVKDESDIIPSPLTCHKSDVSASSSVDLSNMEDVIKTTSLPSQPSFTGSALFATLTSSTPDSMPARSSAQVC